MNEISDFNNLCMGCMMATAGDGTCNNCGFDESKYTPSSQHLPLRTILAGKYLVGRVLGEGGFGITYMGIDLNLEIKVAIKEYYPNGFVARDATHSTVTPFIGEPAEIFEKGRDKFINEAKSLAKFRTLAGIVTVNDFFMENGTAYIVMEYVDGQTMKTYLLTHKFTPAQVFTMMQPVMQSLAYVHQSGMIHRDISPDNIMITDNGQVKLLDFGAARDFADSGNKSLSVILKLGYAPAEQYSSKGQQGPWTDVYALCATMYKIITGITPEESIDRVENDELKPPSKLGIPIDKGQEEALLKGMAVRRTDRFATIAELMDALYPKKASDVTVAYTPTNQPPKSKPQEKPVPKPVEPKPERPVRPTKEKKPLDKKLVTGIACGAGAVLLAAVIALSMPKGQPEEPTAGAPVAVSQETQQPEVKNSGIIPDVVNLQLEEAQEKLSKSLNWDNQTYLTHFDYNPDVPKGFVFHQDNDYAPPASWNWQEDRQLVELKVSLGADDASDTQVRSIPWIEVINAYMEGIKLHYVNPIDRDIQGFLVELSLDNGNTWKTIQNARYFSSEEDNFYFNKYHYDEEHASDPMAYWSFPNNLFAHMAMSSELDGKEFKLRLVTVPNSGTGKNPGYTYLDTAIKITNTLPKPEFTVSKVEYDDLDLKALKESSYIFESVLNNPDSREYLKPYKLKGNFKKGKPYIVAENSRGMQDYRCITNGELIVLLKSYDNTPDYPTFAVMEVDWENIKNENGMWSANYSKPTIVQGTMEHEEFIYSGMKMRDSILNELSANKNIADVIKQQRASTNTKGYIKFEYRIEYSENVPRGQVISTETVKSGPDKIQTIRFTLSNGIPGETGYKIIPVETNEFGTFYFVVLPDDTLPPEDTSLYWEYSDDHTMEVHEGTNRNYIVAQMNTDNYNMSEVNILEAYKLMQEKGIADDQLKVRVQIQSEYQNYEDTFTMNNFYNGLVGR